MSDLLKAVEELIKSVAKQPMMSLLLVIFLVLIWVQVDKLDNINDTLNAIHRDNVLLHEYVVAEELSTEKYIAVVEDMRVKIALILEKLDAGYTQ
jgi:uncharacterized BrkB/YihY/UPF0761 family membrane protein